MLTTEQQDIVDAVVSNQYPVILVNARAGAAKSYTAVESAIAYHKVHPNATFRYLVYGRKASEDAKADFGPHAIVSNLHQLAYHHTIRSTNMYVAKTPYIAWKSIPKSYYIFYSDFRPATELIDEFVTSTDLSFKSFCSERDIPQAVQDAAQKLLNGMSRGELGCTHDFYLKKFHVDVLLGKTQLLPVDVLAVDEVNDVTPITLDIVKAYPAKVKLLLGDPAQRIFDFLGCIDAFPHFPDAKQLTLSTSFRCNTQLAAKIQSFARSTFDPSFVFKGIDYTNPIIKSRAYLSATNAALINKMLELETQDIPFKLATKAKIKQMFELPLAVIRVKPGNTETNSRFIEYQHIVDRWDLAKATGETKLGKLAYLMEALPEDYELRDAVKLILKHSPKTIIEAHKSAYRHLDMPADLTLLTYHTSKGATFDSVELDESINDMISPVLLKLELGESIKHEDITKLYGYYVAVSRARHNVINCKYL